MSSAELLAMRKGFQLLLQDPFNCLPPNLPVGRTIALPLQIHGEKRTPRDREKVAR
jgi:peptide/nickel transport system ATP-binding protein